LAADRDAFLEVMDSFAREIAEASSSATSHNPSTFDDDEARAAARGTMQVHLSPT
jgi:hypothetical protein